MDEPVKTFHLGPRPTQAVEESSTKFTGDFRATPQGRALKAAYIRALALDSKIPLWIKQMEGGSGRKYRYLVNNLVAATPDARYLEIGSYKGSTLCSAIFGNAAKATCIDHWKEFANKVDGGGRPDFDRHVARAINDNIKLSIIENDFRAVDYGAIGKFNLYCFDGPHQEQDQYDGVTLVRNALDDTYILIIDDWNLLRVRTGTMRALADLGAKIVCSIEILTTQNDDFPTLLASWFSDWHNGYFLGVIKKGRNLRNWRNRLQSLLAGGSGPP